MQVVDQDLLQEITRRLVAQFQPEQIILFGSHAWGVPDRYSDVDLLVIVPDSSLGDYERAVLGHRCLSELNIPKDILVRTRAEFDFFSQARASLEYQIAKRGKVLYERGQMPARAELAHQGTA
ncbi:MAG: nucleotidyltransferase domain-containing protein [Anaerolineae bacterium]|nr:nucleotidyltransferase domain-containing protein [Anaerolineae bacterium]